MNAKELIRQIDADKFVLDAVRFWDWAADKLRAGYVGRTMCRCPFCGYDRVSLTFLWQPADRELLLWEERCYICRFKQNDGMDDADKLSCWKLQEMASASLNSALANKLGGAAHAQRLLDDLVQQHPDPRQQQHRCDDDCR